MALVVSGFPGVGKSHTASYNSNVVDCDSSHFSWKVTPEGAPKERDINWPGNYIRHIQRLLDRAEYTYIVVSSHKEVREALVSEHIPFLLVFPPAPMKQEYIQRYIDRGIAPDFVKLLEANFDAWVAELGDQTSCTQIQLKSGQYLSDVLRMGERT